MLCPAPPLKRLRTYAGTCSQVRALQAERVARHQLPSEHAAAGARCEQRAASSSCSLSLLICCSLSHMLPCRCRVCSPLTPACHCYCMGHPTIPANIIGFIVGIFFTLTAHDFSTRQASGQHIVPPPLQALPSCPSCSCGGSAWLVRSGERHGPPGHRTGPTRHGMHEVATVQASPLAPWAAP